MSDAKEVERTVGNIVSLLNDANKPAEGLATKMADFVQGGKKLEVIMRFASGTGLWKMLNYIKAAGISIEQWNKSAAAYRAELTGMYTEMAKQKDIQTDLIAVNENLKNIQTKAYRETEMARLKELRLLDELKADQKIDLQQLEQKESIINSGIIKGLTEMYGEQYAYKKLLEDTTIALGEQEDKLKKIRELGTDSDLLKAIGKGPIKDTTQEQLAREAERRGLGKITAGKGIGMPEFDEYKGAKRFFNIRWAGLKNKASATFSFINGLKKMVWSYLAGALSIIGSILMWGAVIVLAVILLKPVFLAMWKSIKKHGPELLERLKGYWAELKIIVEPILAQVLKIWELFIDPKSSFAELIKEIFMLLAGLIYGSIMFTLKVLLPLVLDLSATLFVIIVETAATVLFNIGKWLGEKTLELFNFINVKLVEFNTWAFGLALNALTWIYTELGALWDGFIQNETVSSILSPFQQFFAWAMSSDRLWNVGWNSFTRTWHGMGEGISNFNLDNDLGMQLGHNMSLGGMANGGFVGRSGQYLVGERGPEIVNLRAGSNVTPNHKIGNTINVHVNGRLGASDTELRDIAKRVGSMINREINRTTNAGVRL